jgi:hypothetical protein
MASAGNEKKMQALFRELKLGDEPIAPEFIKVWNRAQETSPGSPRVFRISFGLATASLVVIILSALVLWSRNGQPGNRVAPKVATESTPPGSMPAPHQATPAKPPPARLVRSVVAQSPVRVKSNQWPPKLAALRKADLEARNAIIREAVSISSWQSPTARLMQSPADDVLSSLPQLDRSLNQLKTFLPNTSQ